MNVNSKSAIFVYLQGPVHDYLCIAYFIFFVEPIPLCNYFKSLSVNWLFNVELIKIWKSQQDK